MTRTGAELSLSPLCLRAAGRSPQVGPQSTPQSLLTRHRLAGDISGAMASHQGSLRELGQAERGS